ncbi:MAG: Threonine dehydrogenase and related Zn-dependent dehydrogenases, partial [uncultured Rubrobacteraceae bacterium]
GEHENSHGYNEGVRDQGRRRGRGRGEADPRTRTESGRGAHHGGPGLHLRHSHGQGRDTCGPEQHARARVGWGRPLFGLGRRRVLRGRQGGGRGDHTLFQVQLLPARLREPVPGDARGLQVHHPDGREHGPVLPRRGRAGEPRADPRRPLRPPGGLRYRYALDRVHGRGARGVGTRRDGRGLCSGSGGPLGDHRLQTGRRGSHHRRRVGAGAQGDRAHLRGGRDRGLHGRRFGRADSGPDGRRGRGRRHRGVRVPPNVGRGDPGHQARRTRSQHRLPRREPGAPGSTARALRHGHGRQADLRRPVPRGERAAQPHLPAHADRQSRPHADDHPRVRLRRDRAGVRHDAEQGGRYHQTPDPLL